MSELISGKEALIALANGEEVEVRTQLVGNWVNLKDIYEYRIIDILENEHHDQFRLKPRTVNLNGVEVGYIYSSAWDRENPNKVTIEFNSESDARYFNNNALKIFNGV